MSFKRLLSLVGVLALLLHFSCNREKAAGTDTTNHDSHEWSYAGETSPEHWAELEKNSDCSGDRQSPVNIIDLNVVEKEGDTAHNTLFYSPKTTIELGPLSTL